MRSKKYCHFCGAKLVEKLYQGHIRLFCRSCNEPIYENPVPAVCAILADKDNRILFVKRKTEPKKGLWCLPGGFVEPGKTPEDVVLNKLHEKTGLFANIDILIGITLSDDCDHHSILLVCYFVKSISGTLKAGDGVSEAGFFHPENLFKIAFESHLRFIRIFDAAYS